MVVVLSSQSYSVINRVRLDGGSERAGQGLRRRASSPEGLLRGRWAAKAILGTNKSELVYRANEAVTCGLPFVNEKRQ